MLVHVLGAPQQAPATPPKSPDPQVSPFSLDAVQQEDEDAAARATLKSGLTGDLWEDRGLLRRTLEALKTPDALGDAVEAFVEGPDLTPLEKLSQQIVSLRETATPLQDKLDRLDGAIAELQHYLRDQNDPDMRAAAETKLQELQARITQLKERIAENTRQQAYQDIRNGF